MSLRTAMLHQTIGIDVIYSFVIIFASLLIYYSTRELYELSNHKGIKYFRRAFIFFALAYFSRFFIQFFVAFLGIQRSTTTQLGLIVLLTLIIFMYASTTAIFYLGASVHSRLFKNKYAESVLHVVALLLSFAGVFTQNLTILLLIQTALVIAFALTIYTRERKNKKKSYKLFFLYSLLALFWMLNILDITIPDFFQLVQLLIYLVSIGIFLFLLYRVTKKTGS